MYHLQINKSNSFRSRGKIQSLRSGFPVAKFLWDLCPRLQLAILYLHMTEKKDLGVFCLCLIWDRVCIPVRPGTCWVTRLVWSFHWSPVSASQMPGLQIFTAISGLEFFFCCCYYYYYYRHHHPSPPPFLLFLLFLRRHTDSSNLLA